MGLKKTELVTNGGPQEFTAQDFASWLLRLNCMRKEVGKSFDVPGLYLMVSWLYQYLGWEFERVVESEFGKSQV